MIPSQSAPFILIMSIALLVLSGIVTLTWGRRLPRNGDWLVGLFLAVLTGALIFAGNGLVEEGAKVHVWLRGWIWPVDLEGALTAGIIQDAQGLVLSGLGVVFASLLMAGSRVLPNQPRPERIYSAIAFAAAGCALSWIALTPWLSLVGLSLVVFSGFVSLGSRWDGEEESQVAIRFARERTFGLILAVLGASGLAGGRAPLAWSKAHWLADAQSLSLTETAGAALLIIGILVQLHPFPLLSWVVSPGKTTSWVRVTLTQVFPAWAAFGILIRLQSSLGAPGVFTVLGWVMLASTVLAVVSGMLQSKWDAALAAWFSAGASLAAAVLCLASPQPALALIIGLGLGASALACCLSLIQTADAAIDGEEGVGGTVTGTKVAAFFGIAAGIGVLGFVSAGGAVNWLMQAWRDPALAAAALSAFSLFAMLGWKLGWMMSRRKLSSMPHWSALIVPTLFILLSLGILWSGDILGGALPGGADHVGPSLMELLFGPSTVSVEQSAPVFGAYLGAIVLSLAAAYWASIQTRELEPEGWVQKLYDGIVSGYGVDRLVGRAISGLTRAIASVDLTIEKRVWGNWVPKGLTVIIRSTSSAITRADDAVSVHGRKVVRQWIDSPAKFLQLIQNGDVQWYLLFGVGSGLLILAHYLLSAGMPR